MSLFWQAVIGWIKFRCRSAVTFPSAKIGKGIVIRGRKGHFAKQFQKWIFRVSNAAADSDAQTLWGQRDDFIFQATKSELELLAGIKQ
jgi:hypothetical protein